MFFIPLWVGFSSARRWAPFRSSCSFILHFKGSRGRRFATPLPFRARRGDGAHGGPKGSQRGRAGRWRWGRVPRGSRAPTLPRGDVRVPGGCSHGCFTSLRLFPRFVIKNNNNKRCFYPQAERRGKLEEEAELRWQERPETPKQTKPFFPLRLELFLLKLVLFFVFI